MRQSARSSAGLAAVALLALAAALPARAVPRYSLAVGQKCVLCHTNPTGGGIRDDYTSEYLVPERLSMKLPGNAERVHSPRINDSAAIGADLRTFWMRRDDRDAGGNFREMQGSVYLSLSPGDPRFTLYVHQDFGQIDEAVEVWGLGYVLPASGYVKVGRLVPAFGWKIPDHRAFSRREYLFFPPFPPESDTGVEIGLYPGSFTFEASVLNGQFRSPVDLDESVAVTGRASWIWTREPFYAVVGGSWYRNHGGNGDVDAVGPLAAARWGRVTWLGELDWKRRGDDSGAVWGVVTTQEVAVQLVQGLDALGTYDFFDPDVDLATGALHRIGVGVDAFVLPFLRLSGKVNFFVTEDGEALASIPEAAGGDAVETQLQAHVLY